MFNSQGLIPEFVIECKAHVEKIEAGLLAAEKGQEDTDIINAIFRSAHSIKGTAGFFALNKIVELAHAIESLLEQIRNDAIRVDLKMIDALLAANDGLKVMIENVADCEKVNTEPFIHKLNGILGEIMSSKDRNPLVLPPVMKASCGESVYETTTNCLDGNYEKLVSEAIKHGHKLYRLSVNLGSGSDGKKKRTEISGNIKLIGNMIAESICKDDSEGADAVFLFSSVLEKDLIVMGLDCDESAAVGLEQTTQDEFNELLWAERRKQSYLKEMSHSNLGLHQQEVLPKAERVLERDAAGHAYHAKEDDRIRVNVNLLDSLVNLSGELVLGRNQLLRILENHVGDITGLSGVLQNLDHITTEIQEKVMRTRLQPLANVFDKMPRFVRELSRSIGKKAELHIEGAGVELDKSIIEGLADPLSHLVRNALDHGIETPDLRKALGKPETATLGIKAYHEGGRVIIDIADDGAGISVEKIKQKALSQGMISKKLDDDMNAHDLLSLIFLPGFSTAERVTDISGRGVGLDAAKSSIERLGGTVDIHTTEGVGTTFRLILPLTLAIMPSVIVAISNYRFALPQTHLQQIVRIRPGDNSQRIEFIQGQRILRLRDKLLPVIHLEELFGIPARYESSTGITKVLIVKSSFQVFGLIVDAIYDREEILVKPMPRYLRESKAYSGVTILGDGKIAMVLDVDGIAAAVKPAAVAKQEAGWAASEESRVSPDAIEKQEILLFKCSGPEIFGLNLGLVARVDEIDVGKIEPIGDKEYINLRGSVLRLVRPEDFLPVTKANTSQHKLRIITPKLAKYPMAILAETIQDTIQAVVKIQEADIKAKGILGSAVLKDRIVLVVNLPELIEISSQQPHSLMAAGDGQTDRTLQQGGESHDW